MQLSRSIIKSHLFNIILDILEKWPRDGAVMSFTDQIAKIVKAKADIAAAEAKFAADRVAALAKLPADFGFPNVSEFLKAVQDAAGKKVAKGKSASKNKAAAKTAAPASSKGTKARSKRTKITDEIKAKVKAMAEAGKTGQEIATSLSISAPTVQNIKKALGLVKARGASSAEPESAAATGESVIA